MPRSYVSSHDDADDYDYAPSSRQSQVLSMRSPAFSRRIIRSTRASEVDLRSRMPSRSFVVDERSSLLGSGGDRVNQYRSVPVTPRPPLGRTVSSQIDLVRGAGLKNHSRAGSFGARLASALNLEGRSTRGGPNLEESTTSFFYDDRVWYDQFTSTDWVHDSIADAFRIKALRSRKDFRGRVWAFLDGGQGWLLVAIIGCITACIAYFVDVTETIVFDVKNGYCDDGWYFSRKKCCMGVPHCEQWRRWPEVLSKVPINSRAMEFITFVVSVMVLATLSSFLTLATKTVVPSAISLSTLDEDLGADSKRRHSDKQSPSPNGSLDQPAADVVYYSAAGSGVAEVKVILSGFVLHGYLGVKTLIVKTLALILSVASGLSIGKEGPYVHIATCVGNIACRLFSKYNHNDGKRREVLSASAASGVAVAFGAPIGGVLFSLEEVSYYFPPKTLFRTFFCCIAAALSLKFLNPYGTQKIVMFEVRYSTDWRIFEMLTFVLLGVLGGAAGALFIKASRIWARTFRRISFVKRWPIVEVMLVALTTGAISFWNRYARLAVTELLFELASPCGNTDGLSTGLCPRTAEQIPGVISSLAVALVIKSFLTIITFGIKVPAGIYVPSMVVGGLMGRIVGHTVQYLTLRFPDATIFQSCPVGGGPESCITPGVYAMVAAGATMCGVTRLSVTLAVILFELTGSLDHVLPFSIAILVSKWTADAMEPLSIYDLLTDMNSYPFLDNKVRPIFTTELGDITGRRRPERIIDISSSPVVRARDLRRKLEYLHEAGELDGGLPIVRHNVLVGLIPAPDLEFALDKLEDEDSTECLMGTNMRWQDSGSEDEGPQQDPSDFTPYIDPAPVALEIRSPMDLVYECFVKLGLRYICVLRDGHFAGLVHKKAFVRYVKDLEDESP